MVKMVVMVDTDEHFKNDIYIGRSLHSEAFTMVEEGASTTGT